MTKLFGSSAITTVEEPNFCPAALREIKITPEALEKIYALAEIVVEKAKKGYEAYCLLLGTEEGLVEDILIPEQEVSSFSVEISKDALLKTIEELNTLDSNYQVLGWAHSHAYMTAYSSSTDDDNHVTILNQTNNIRRVNEKKTKFAYGLTVALSPRDHYGVVVSQFECGALVQREASLIVFDQNPDSPFDPKKIKAEIKEDVLKKVKIRIPRLPKRSKWKWNWDWSDWFKSRFNRDSTHETPSIEENFDHYTGYSSYFEEKSEDQWPNELKGSYLVDTILSDTSITGYVEELCDQWRDSVGEDNFHQRLEDILEIAILATLEHVKNTLVNLTMKEEEDAASEEEWSPIVEVSNANQTGGDPP